VWSLSNGAQRRFGAGSREVIGAGVSCEAYQVWRTRYLQSGGAKKHGTKCRMCDLQTAAHLGFPWKRVLNPSTTIRCEPIAGGALLRETPTTPREAVEGWRPSQRLHQRLPCESLEGPCIPCPGALGKAETGSGSLLRASRISPSTSIICFAFRSWLSRAARSSFLKARSSVVCSRRACWLACSSVFTPTKSSESDSCGTGSGA